MKHEVRDGKKSPKWSIEIGPGWRQTQPMYEQSGSEAVAFTPASSDALLTLTTFDPAASGNDAANWVEQVARINRLKQRSVVTARIAELMGYRIEFDTESVHIRAWALRYRDEPLDVTYRCDRTIAGRDDATVDTMLLYVGREYKGWNRVPPVK